tara:strand:- start:485 stop:790 length:306 start_codon:yes stop_codon:yes gene_type:complete
MQKIGVDMKTSEIIKAIHKMDTNSLNEVISACKLRRNQIHYQDTQSFSVGDRVSFKGRGGVIEKGVIEKVKIKYILVRTDTGPRWNVPGSHLKKIKETTSA